MYSFDMTSEQKMLVDTVHRYAEKQLRNIYGRRKSRPQRQVQPSAQAGNWACCLPPSTQSMVATASIPP